MVSYDEAMVRFPLRWLPALLILGAFYSAIGWWSLLVSPIVYFFLYFLWLAFRPGNR